MQECAKLIDHIFVAHVQLRTHENCSISQLQVQLFFILSLRTLIIVQKEGDSMWKEECPFLLQFLGFKDHSS